MIPRIVTWSFGFLLVFSSWLPASDLDQVVIPRKTDLFIVLERAINSRTAMPGDKFYGRVSVPLTMDDRIVLPVGTFIIGHVDLSQTAGRLKGKAQLGLKFDSIILPDGTTRQIEAIVESAEGHRTDHTREDGTLEAEGSQGRETAEGAVGGAVTGAVIGTSVGAARGSTLKGLGVGTAVGAAGGAIVGVLQKGRDVNLPKGTALTIQLEDDIRFVPPRPRAPREILEP